MKLQEFENSYQKSEQKLQFYQKKSNRLSIIRFCLFILAILVLLIGYFQKKNIQSLTNSSEKKNRENYYLELSYFTTTCNQPSCMI